MHNCPICGGNSTEPWLTSGPKCSTCRAKEEKHKRDFLEYRQKYPAPVLRDSLSEY